MCWLWTRIIWVRFNISIKIRTPCFCFDRSSSKFDSHCGWPAFSSSIGTSVRRQKDSDGYREEILCANCDGHLGHVFKGEGLRDDKGKLVQERHCVNSASLKFEKGK